MRLSLELKGDKESRRTSSRMKPRGSWQDVAPDFLCSPAHRAHPSDSFNTHFLAGGETDMRNVQGLSPDCGISDMVDLPQGATTRSAAVTGAGFVASSSSSSSPLRRTRAGDASSPGGAHVSPQNRCSDPPVSASLAGRTLVPTGLPNVSDDGDISLSLDGTRDLQRGLLEQKLQHLQRELNAVRAELKETSTRLSHVTVKLNEQKMEFSTVTHRYGSTVEKLTAAESSVKRLEEHLVSERKQHSVVREERDGLKSSLRELDREVKRLSHELQAERERNVMDPREVQHMLEDRTRFIPTAELQQRLDDMRDTQHAYMSRFSETLDTLLFLQEEDETSVFVSRSAVLSAATDLEAKVASAESTLAALRHQLELFNEESEHDMVEMITTLMMENKELWQHLSKLKSDHDTVVTQLSALRRKENHIPRDQHEYTQKQLALTNEKLSKAQEAVELQVKVAKEHEEQMKAVLNSNESLQGRVCQLSEQLMQAEEELKRRGKQLEEARTQVEEALRRSDEVGRSLDGERRQMESTIMQLNEKFSTMEKECEHHISHLQMERNAARKDAEQALRKLGDMQERTETLQRELDLHTRHFETYKQQVEEHQQHVNRSLQEEMNSARELLVHDLSLTRRDLEDQRTAAREAERQRDDEHAERRAAEAVAAGLELELAQQRRENEQQRRRAEEVTARLQKLEVEADQFQQRRNDALGEVRELQRDVMQSQERCQELEKQLQEQRELHTEQMTHLKKERQQLEHIHTNMQDELKRLRIRITELEQQRIPRERTDVERENLMRENLRLHEQYREVQQDNVALRESLQQLQGKILNFDQISQQLDNMQERLQQLPALRQAAEDAKRDAVRATEETEELRQERDAMAAKLNFFLEESKQAAKKDEEWSRVFRDAVEQTQRLGGQVSMAKQQRKKERAVPLYVSAHPSGYSDQFSNYQRVLGNDNSGGENLRNRPLSPSRLPVDGGSPQPSAPAPLHRPWH